MPSSRCSERSRSRIWPWMVTSSAVVGSSAIRGSGRRSARARSSRAGACRRRTPTGSGRARRWDRGCRPWRAGRRRGRAPPARPTSSWTCTTSVICAPMVWTGENELIGSWKIMPMRRAADRLDRLAVPAQSRRCRPRSRRGRAAGCGRRRSQRPAPSSCISDSAVTLLPEPLSPTSASTSPRPIAKDTSSMMAIARAVLAERDRQVASTLRTGAARRCIIITANRGRRRRAGRRRRS